MAGGIERHRGAGARGQPRREPRLFVGRRRPGQAEDAGVHDTPTAVPNAAADHVVGDADPAHLGSGDDAELPRREIGNEKVD